MRTRSGTWGTPNLAAGAQHTRMRCGEMVQLTRVIDVMYAMHVLQRMPNHRVWHKVRGSSLEAAHRRRCALMPCGLDHLGGQSRDACDNVCVMRVMHVICMMH